MIIKFLGFFDFLVIFVMLLSPFLPFKYMLYAALYLLLKGALFAFGGDIASYLDVGCGTYLMFFAFGISSMFINVIVGLYLAQKFAISWL